MNDETPWTVEVRHYEDANDTWTIRDNNGECVCPRLHSEPLAARIITAVNNFDAMAELLDRARFEMDVGDSAGWFVEVDELLTQIKERETK